MPRIELVALVEPHYPKFGGRKSYSLESMPRIHLLQNGFSLSAPAMEKALYEITLMGLFARLTLSAPIPEDITPMNFRHFLGRHQFAAGFWKPGQGAGTCEGAAPVTHKNQGKAMALSRLTAEKSALRGRDSARCVLGSTCLKFH